MSDNLKKVNKFLTAIGCRDLKAISSVCRDDFVYEVASKSIEFNTLKGDEAFLFLSVMSGEFYQDMTFDYQIIRSVETLELMVVE
ncbi:hypothetical protein MD535_10045, partial [Vibrio sp. ZSDZ65]